MPFSLCCRVHVCAEHEVCGSAQQQCAARGAATPCGRRLAGGYVCEKTEGGRGRRKEGGQAAGHKWTTMGRGLPLHMHWTLEAPGQDLIGEHGIILCYAALPYKGDCAAAYVHEMQCAVLLTRLAQCCVMWFVHAPHMCGCGTLLAHHMRYVLSMHPCVSATPPCRVVSA